MTVGWLTERRRAYFEDARRLAEMGDEQIADMTAAQWAVVYRAVANELKKCAEENQ